MFESPISNHFIVVKSIQPQCWHVKYKNGNATLGTTWESYNWLVKTSLERSL